MRHGEQGILYASWHCPMRDALLRSGLSLQTACAQRVFLPACQAFGSPWGSHRGAAIVWQPSFTQAAQPIHLTSQRNIIGAFF